MLIYQQKHTFDFLIATQLKKLSNKDIALLNKQI